jgi:peptide-methionine (S)-S-oxide reductase
MIRLALTACLMPTLLWTACSVEQANAGAPAIVEKPEKEEVTNMQYALFGAGCFWGVEAAFRSLEGVLDAECGYAGGNLENPSYKQVCNGDTGHAEVVRVAFDPGKVSYQKLLDVFWKIHDPTQVNRQGPDIGSQYRSVIFTLSPEQHDAANESKSALDKSGRFNRPIATEILPAPVFYRAEEYHQRYFEKTGRQSCHVF